MKRRSFTPEFKKKVAVEALREQRSINEIAHAHEISPIQVRKWKKELLDGAKSIFEDPRKKDAHLKEQKDQEAVLQQKIGQLTVENDFLKKKLDL